MMREYESVFVLDPSIEDTQVDTELEKIKEFLGSRNSEITEIQKWGRRKLAYEVRKRKEGVYTLIRFQAEPEVPAELDRRYRLNENMLRFLTVAYEAPPAVEEPAAEAGAAGARESGGGEKPKAEAAPKAEEPPKAEAAPKAEEPPKPEAKPEEEAAEKAGSQD